jgi:outer membrane protein insertion porin family
LLPLRTALLLSAALALSVSVPTGAGALPKHKAVTPAAADTSVISAIKVVGNQRIEEGTILSYLLLQPGDRFAADKMDRSLRTLYATGLFADVQIGRDGSALLVRVLENPLVAGIFFEGNRSVKEEDLRKALSLRPRAVFSPNLAQADQQHLLSTYAQKGRFAATVEPQIVRLPENRVNVVFKIVEGDEAEISRIAFLGNKVFSENELRAAIDSREQRWWRFLSSADQFNADRVDYDRELLRRFYLTHGYADAQVVSEASELSPDRKAFYLTFKVSEGERYKVGAVSIKSSVPKIDATNYSKLIGLTDGDYYNGEKIHRAADDITDQLHSDGFTFVDVEPKISRDPQKHTVDLLYEILPGPRVYIERIDIAGNSRTKDQVIRREMHFAEGDAYDSSMARRARQSISDLGYFGDVKVTSTPGSADDKTVVDVDVTEKATGELSLGGGYSTTSGALVQTGLREHNLVGTGIDAGINASLAQHQRQVDLSATDPYFLDRNLVAGFDIFYMQNNDSYNYSYSESRVGTAVRLGYRFNDHVSEAWTYSLVDRTVGNLQSYASIFVQDEAGTSLLSQLGTTFMFDWRDSRIDPHEGYILRVGSDFAGLGGDVNYVRGKIDGNYYIPLDRWSGNADWTIALAAGTGYLDTLSGKQRIIDRFFLGGDNLRGFRDQGVGPRAIGYTEPDGTHFDSVSLGGNFIWTQSTELRFPLPVSKDFGMTGRAFVDLGGLSQYTASALEQVTCHGNTTGRPGGGPPLNDYQGPCAIGSASPRMSAGIGLSWNSPFGLINIDAGIPVMKQDGDQTQLIRFGFGTRFQ